MTTTETIKSNLRRIRVALDLTQEEAAFRCGMSTRHYSTIENGDVNMSVSTLDKLCDGLNVMPYELLGVHIDAPLKFTCIQTTVNSEVVYSEELDTQETYGIAIDFPSESEQRQTLICADVSVDRAKVESLVSLLNELQPSVAHSEEIIEDFLVELCV